MPSFTPEQRQRRRDLRRQRRQDGAPVAQPTVSPAASPARVPQGGPAILPNGIAIMPPTISAQTAPVVQPPVSVSEDEEMKARLAGQPQVMPAPLPQIAPDGTVMPAPMRKFPAPLGQPEALPAPAPGIGGIAAGISGFRKPLLAPPAAQELGADVARGLPWDRASLLRGRMLA